MAQPSFPRRRARRRLRRVVVLLALLALAAGTSGDVASLVERVDDPVFARAAPTTTTTTAPPPTTTTTEPPPAEWTVLAGGDVLLEDAATAGADPFGQLVPAPSEADLALTNAEMAIAAGGEAREDKEFVFRAPPSAAETLAAAGFDVVNLGNNHALDFGRDALLESIANLRNAGTSPVGAGADAGEAHAPATFTIGGGASREVSVAVLGASDVVPEGWGVGSRAGIATTREDALVEAVRAAERVHDVVVITVHWGVELAECPNERQVALGDRLVAAGADAVLGHHPHVLQPVVERGDGLVAYSLGNLVWGDRGEPQDLTGLLEVRFVGDRYDGFTFHPHRMEGGVPVPADSETEERITARIERDIEEDCVEESGGGPTTEVTSTTAGAQDPPPD